MKVIFLQDVPRVAYAGDIKEVADGYARNYLIPKQLAAAAKPGAINMVTARQAKMATEFSELASKIEGVEINLKARVGAKDRLFGAITAADIATPEYTSLARTEYTSCSVYVRSTNPIGPASRFSFWSSSVKPRSSGWLTGSGCW